jgi:curved DNA-binding protein CbpA
MKPPPTRDYYEVLGVARNATDTEIKRNYRQKAAGAHPDKKSGSHEEMAEITEAYRVLSDPVLRKRYDETGSIDDPEEILNVKIREMVVAAFNEALAQEAPHVLMFARQFVGQIKKTLLKAQAKLPRVKLRMEEMRSKITTTDEHNLFQMTVDQQLRHADDAVKRIEFDLEVCNGAEAVLAKYTSDEEIPTLTLAFGEHVTFR